MKPFPHVIPLLENGTSFNIDSLASVAAKALLSGGVIALPTDTIYGIAALAQDPDAVQKIYKIKSRQTCKPLAICVADIDDIFHWGQVTVSRELLERLLPGPVTLVFRRSSKLNPALNPGTDLVGIRIPDHDFVKAVCQQCRGPLALTSANISSGLSPLCIKEFSSLWPQLAFVFDGGKLGDTKEARLGSTVVDLSHRGQYSFIRPGCACLATQSILEGGGLTSVKATISQKLSECFKELAGRERNEEHAIVNDDLTNQICSIIEAVFVHGLRAKFFAAVSDLISTNPDFIPNPSFWDFLLVYLHKDLISEIQSLSQISTDIGKSRAWIRIAMNEGLLSSYFKAMVSDTRNLKFCYHSHAYMRDAEEPEIMLKYLESLETYSFKLAFNSSVLNKWTVTPLLLAGVWSPPIPPDPVVQGIDALLGLENEQGVSRNHKRQHPLSSGSDPNDNNMTSSTFDAEEVFRSIIQSGQHGEESRGGGTSQLGDGALDMMKDIVHYSVEPIDEDLENRIIRRIQESRSEDKEEEVSSECPGSSITGQEETSASDGLLHPQQPGHARPTRAISIQESYNTLLNNYKEVIDNTVIKTPDFKELWGSLGSPSSTDASSMAGESSEDMLQEHSETTEQPVSSLVSKDSPEVKVNIPQFNESGAKLRLIYIHFICASSHLVLKGWVLKLWVLPMLQLMIPFCMFDGSYYCYECHEEEKNVIPARMIHNWDFTAYHVSKEAKKFLQSIQNEPLLDIKSINPLIYSYYPEMQKIQELRRMLNYLRLYLMSCRGSPAEEFRKIIWPKEYLCEHIHLYSIQDLQQVLNSQLAGLLQKAIDYATSHVLKCALCCQKGFICEVCRQDKVIFPFHLNLTHRCSKCHAVYHSQCMNDLLPCPKCKRREKRAEEAAMRTTPVLSTDMDDGVHMSEELHDALREK
ncbi:unnamed protein product [Darwinula stevensoni]|uniref:Threonylcarbamoyl-AMP synthase n=1 Tax=Darwinula stevensoni TaxID=69355 RepID=A0A7R8WY67_9CRUS|nr:unnamed protein product [Darwinula stevensoni]CAG0878671.1 unnamed protein product [Darwinula stevensoni]